MYVLSKLFTSEKYKNIDPQTIFLGTRKKIARRPTFLNYIHTLIHDTLVSDIRHTYILYIEVHY
jgi:hypothetical protein